MFGKVAARTVATLTVLLPLVFGGPVTALAQYQVNFSALTPPETMSQAPAAAEPFGLSAESVT